MREQRGAQAQRGREPGRGTQRSDEHLVVTDVYHDEIGTSASAVGSSASTRSLAKPAQPRFSDLDRLAGRSADLRSELLDECGVRADEEPVGGRAAERDDRAACPRGFARASSAGRKPGSRN